VSLADPLERWKLGHGRREYHSRTYLAVALV
jgi:hypothetical protein